MLTPSHPKEPDDIQIRRPERETVLARSSQLQLVQLELEGDVLTAVPAVVVREAAAGDTHVLAHVDGPCVVGVAAEQAVGADLDTVGPDEVGVVAAGIRVSRRLCDWERMRSHTNTSCRCIDTS